MFDIDHSLFGDDAIVIYTIEISPGVSPAHPTVTIRNKIQWVNRCGALKRLESVTGGKEITKRKILITGHAAHG